MNRLLVVATVLLVAQVFFHVQRHRHRWYLQEASTRVTLYGSAGCPNCEDLREKLDANGIPYEYVDVMSPADTRAEAVDRFKQLTPQVPQTFYFPVVIVDDEVVFGPTFEGLMASYGARRLDLAWALSHW